MNIGMDGPNVNRKFEKDLIKDLEIKKSSSFLTIGSCDLHTVNNGFGKGINVLKEVSDLDQFAIDLHCFSNYQPPEEKTMKRFRVSRKQPPTTCLSTAQKMVKHKKGISANY